MENCSSMKNIEKELDLNFSNHYDKIYFRP